MARFLAAVDRSVSATTSLDYTVATARRQAASVHVLFVNTRRIRWGGHQLLSRPAAEAVVTSAMEQLADAGVETTGSVAWASGLDVARVIVDVADQQGCDTIVLGSQRRRWLARLLGRGIREQVISRSPLPVIAAPAPLRLPGGWRRFDPDHAILFLGERSARTRP
jgi:nucleotide-binding universal stress UspA family protein